MHCRTSKPGFTLLELLVVVTIIALMIGILLPTLSRAKASAREVKCLAAINMQLKAVHVYATEHDDALVCGSDHPLLYPGQAPQPPIDSLASFQFWLGLNQEYGSLGVLLAQGYLDGRILFCPDDEDADAQAELEKARIRSSESAWCSYLYRQLDGQVAVPARTQLHDLGANAVGDPVIALVMDVHSTMVWPGLPLKANHEGQKTTIGHTDGSAKLVKDRDQKLTINGATSQVYQRLDQILQYADSLCK